IRGVSARPVPPREKEPLVATVKDFGNIERPANICAKARLVVRGFRRREATERIRSGIKRGVVIGKIEDTMRLIHVEAAAAAPDSDGAAAHSSGRSCSGAASALTAAEGKDSLSLQAVAELLDALLDIFFTSGSEVRSAPLRPGDADRFRRSFR